MMLFRAVPSPRSSLNAFSPFSSVQTALPMRPVVLSLKTMASARKPTPGREGPESTREPSNVEMDARRPSLSCRVLRLPAEVQTPWNSRHSLGAACVTGGVGPQAVKKRSKKTTTQSGWVRRPRAGKIQEMASRLPVRPRHGLDSLQAHKRCRWNRTVST